MNNNNELMLDVSQAHELKLALRREGSWTNEEIKMLCERKGLLTQVREVLLNRAEIKSVEYSVDLDAEPFVPEGWKVEEHKKGGKFKYNPLKVRLYLDKDQQNGKVINGNELRKKLKNQKVMNANILDFLLKNPHLIFESWKGKAIFFWGTIYRYSDGDLYVRYLYWVDGRWIWNNFWLDSEFSGSYPSAVSAS